MSIVELTSIIFHKTIDIFHMHSLRLDTNMEQDTSKFNSTDHLDLNVDIHSQNFDVIRLASYRTAVKFRFVQRRTHRNSLSYYHFTLRSINYICFQFIWLMFGISSKPSGRTVSIRSIRTHRWLWVDLKLSSSHFMFIWTSEFLSVNSSTFIQLLFT